MRNASFIIATLAFTAGSLCASHSTAETVRAAQPTALGEVSANSCEIRWTRTASRGEAILVQNLISCPSGTGRQSRCLIQVQYEGRTFFTTAAELEPSFLTNSRLSGSGGEYLSAALSKCFGEAEVAAAQARARSDAELEKARAAAEVERTRADAAAAAELERARAQQELERAQAEAAAKEAQAKENAERALATAALRKRLANAPFAILKFRPYDVSEHTNGTGIEIEIANLSRKVVKYLTFRYVGLNAVNDPVTDLRGAANRGFRGIGPIGPNETGWYERDYAWMTDIVETVRILRIDVEYMDGTRSTVTRFDRIRVSEEEAELLGIVR